MTAGNITMLEFEATILGIFIKLDGQTLSRQELSDMCEFLNGFEGSQIRKTAADFIVETRRSRESKGKQDGSSI
jgi:hypothetical protein